ncbi:maleylacetate reductase [Variovorax paradoxus]|uniref:maleylacetate reductase n=1 Tax=Variovorax paradoxus TaxID=34073 RepID=UPI002788D155|nr:maleylacetate reductase [Variovorax paradoxus]MDP9927833.1 alcohol dehydrogenase class IV [Variovorax paradoxus]
MNPFIYGALPLRVIFERKALFKAGEELERLGARRVLLISTPSKHDEAATIAAAVGQRLVGHFDQEAPHVRIEIAEVVRGLARSSGADSIIALGGGSTIGLAKAVAVDQHLPIIAIPTTYSGSEVTPVYGMTENGVKHGHRDPASLPKTVLYDPELIVSMPPMLSLTSGMNAMAHSVEALYAQDANPIISLMAEESIRALAQSLPAVVERPGNIDARQGSFYGSWLAGMSLAGVGMSLHHKLCHTLGGSFGLPHAETHTVVLPYAVDYNAEAAPQAMARVARALGSQEGAARGLWSLVKRLGGPTSLQEIGMRREDLDRAAELAMKSPYYSPRPVEQIAIRGLLEDAFLGKQPTS